MDFISLLIRSISIFRVLKLYTLKIHLDKHFKHKNLDRTWISRFDLNYA